MGDKPKVFVITPFSEEFLALYDELKRVFESDFEFSNAGDLDNQRDILQDIVSGIYEADVIIADLTGLNANVFYELGLAHAMNKKVIIITQDIGELPFDIKSYRSNEYSLQFNKLPRLIEELKKLLFGAIDNSVKYGSPVSDYIPDFFKNEGMVIKEGVSKTAVTESENDIQKNREEKGFLDFIADIEEYANKMINEIELLGRGMEAMGMSISTADADIERVKDHSGKADVGFVRNICRKLSEPVNSCAVELKTHVNNIAQNWNVIENSYLSLLESPYTKTVDYLGDLKESVKSLESMQESILESDQEIEKFIKVLQGCMGIERRLNKAITVLIFELEGYLTMTDTIVSSVDRILSRADVVLDS